MRTKNRHLGLKRGQVFDSINLMDLTNIEKVNQSVGLDIMIAGWLVNKRSSGGIEFLQIRDGSGVIQAVVDKEKVGTEVFTKSQSLTQESSLVATGNVREEERSPSGFELDVKDLEIVQRVEEEYPIGNKEHGVDFLLENRHLWLRSPKQRAIQRVRNQIILGIFEFFEERGFVKIDTPIFTPSACEGTTTLFAVPYFDKKVYLAQSGQLYLEADIASFGKVFDFGPTFRAEKSKTRRHLTEFWMMDAEVAFMDHKGNMKLQEDLIDHIVQRVLRKSQKELGVLERDVGPLEDVKGSFDIVTYEEAVKKLQELGSDIEFGKDFGNDDETLLTKELTRPIFIEKFPAEIKAFYMKRDAEDPSLSLCSDLLAPEGYGAIIGGSQREVDYETLKKRIEEHNLSLKDFDWYLDLRKFGSVPHSGFGLGLERVVSWICGLSHVREAIPFPRTIYRVRP